MVINKRHAWWLAALMSSAVAPLAMSCDGEAGEKGEPGEPGTSGDGGGGSCTVKDNGNGTKTITCDDGTTVTINDGENGLPGDAGDGCTATQDNDAGTLTVTCGGSSVTVPIPTTPDGGGGATGTPGAGLKVETSTNAPANTTHFAAGEKIVFKAKLTDGKGNPLTLDQMLRANLYMNGPRAYLKNKTAVKLLKAETDRTKTPHHYIDLKKAPPNLTVNGNEITYTMEAVTDEAPGTYTIALWVEPNGAPQDQKFELKDVQIGTATVEALITDGCKDCHEGAATKKMYLAHIDPGYTVYGNPSLDAVPVQNCKNCHNQDGYAGLRKCADNSKPVADTSTPPKYKCADGTENWTWLSDDIVRRVHGVHNGANLSHPYNTTVGKDFHIYEDLVFPFNVKYCTKCHTDDAWKTKPSRQACGACHDNINWADGKLAPVKVHSMSFTGGVSGKCVTASVCSAGTCNTTSGLCECTTNGDCTGKFNGFNGVCNTTTKKCEIQAHSGGSATDDTGCAMCHKTGGMADIAVAHKVTPVDYPHTIELTAVSAPANGTHYVAGESPKLKIVLKNKDGSTVDHTTITEANGWTRTYLFVNGPRGQRIPGLTTAARAEAGSTVAGPWDLSAAVDLKIKIGNTSITIPTGTVKKAGATAAEVVAWLNANAQFSSLAFATLTGGTGVNILVKPSVSRNALEVLASDVATALGITAKLYTEKSGSGSYAANALYASTDSTKDDPKATRFTDRIEYQLDDVATVKPGTYSVWVSSSKSLSQNALLSIQVGTATVEKKVATNCVDCHGSEKGAQGMHGMYPWDVDVCGSCHDYRRAAADRLATDTFVDGWGASAATGRSNAGFGAGPISRRAHGVHFGHYVDYPKQIHGSYDYSGVIFPQDVRNCVKCHSETPSWKEKPTRLACLACHDSDAAVAHGGLMTADPTPADPWNGDEKESCGTCHGSGKDYSVENVHNVWNPYKTPYKRDP